MCDRPLSNRGRSEGDTASVAFSRSFSWLQILVVVRTIKITKSLNKTVSRISAAAIHFWSSIPLDIRQGILNSQRNSTFGWFL